MGFRGLTPVLAVALALVVSGLALAAAGDPKAGSPPGAVYQLPLDEGRGDAAPHDVNGSASEAPTDGATASPSSSGTASSEAPASEGPSAESTEPGTANAGGGSRVPQSEPGDPGPYYRSENNFGSSSHVPGTPGAGGVTEAVRAAGIDEGNTSTAAAVGLATAFVGAAVLAGLLATRGRRNP